MPSVKEEWVENPGIDVATGELIEASCDDRDYPTLPELAKNLSRSSTGLSVIGYGHVYGVCDDTTAEFTESFDEFYGSTVKYEMEMRGVPYHFTASDMTEADLTMTILEAILEASGSCGYMDESDRPSLPTKAPVTPTDAVSTLPSVVDTTVVSGDSATGNVTTVSGDSATGNVTSGTGDSVSGDSATGNVTSGTGDSVSSTGSSSGSGDSATGNVTTVSGDSVSSAGSSTVSGDSATGNVTSG